MLCDLAFKLDDECLEHKENLLSVLLDSDDEDGGSCLHFLLDSTPGALHPEEPHRCEKCQWSWADLVRECVDKTMALYTTDYPCSHEGSGNVVPSCYLVCPHCSENKVKHLVWLFTKVCGELLNSNILVVPLAKRRHASLTATSSCQVQLMLSLSSSQLL